MGLESPDGECGSTAEGRSDLPPSQNGRVGLRLGAGRNLRDRGFVQIRDLGLVGLWWGLGHNQGVQD